MEYRSCHWLGGSAWSPQCVRPMGCWFFPVPRPPYVCAVSWASWLLFTGVTARFAVLRLRCHRPLGSCSPVCSLGVLWCVCGVLGHLAPVHRCARWVCCVACAVSRATWLLFTSAPARCVALCVRSPGPLGSCSPMCPLGVLCCVCGVLAHLAPVHRCARSMCCFACVVSWATWLLLTGVPAWSLVLRVRCPGPLASCTPVCLLGVLCYVCGVLGHLAPVLRCACWVCCSVCAVLGHLAPVDRCACSVCCFACAVSWATWLPVHRRARSVGCVACAVSRATWLLFTGVPARCVVLCMRCPGPPDSCSPVRPLAALCCVCGVLGLLAPVHLCARSVCCFACAVSWASWLLFTGVRLRVLCCVCDVLGHLAPVHRYARCLLCFVRAASWATWLLFTGLPARCVVLRVRCPGLPGSCSPVCPLSVLCCVYGVLGHLAPVHRCAPSVLCFSCAVSQATWLLFTGVPAWCVVLRVRCPGPPGSCSPVCSLGVLCCVCGVLGHLAPVHRCARSVGCVACTVSWAAWLLYTGVLALCAVLWVARVVLRGRGVAAGRSLVHPDGGCS